MQVHVAMLALRTGRPVKMVYSREESFFGHVHRHPARMEYEHGATRDGRLRLRATPASCSTAAPTPRAARPWSPTRRPSPAGPTTSRAPASRPTSPTPTTRPAGRCAASGPCRSPSPTSRRWTGWRPRLGIDPVELRLRNALEPGMRLPTGQVVDGPAPVREPAGGAPRDAAAAPGPQHPDGPARAARAASPTPPTARAPGAAWASRWASRTSPSPRGSTTTPRPACACRSTTRGPVAEVQTAAAEVGQGLETVLEQIARTELDVERRGRAARRHERGLGGVDVGLAPDLDERRRRPARLRAGARAARRPRGAGRRGRAARGAPARRPGGGDGRLPPPAHPAARPGDRPGRLAGGARLRGPPGRVRRRRRARPGARGRDRHHPGRGPRDEPARPSRARSRAGSRRASGWR